MREFVYSDEVVIEVLRAVAEHIPGVAIITGARCRTMPHYGPEVHNLHMTECTGMLLNHEGPHSWERT